MNAPGQRRPARRSPAPSSSAPTFKASDFIASHPVFCFDEFLQAHTATGASPQTTAALLRYHSNAGRILNVRRGLYVHHGPIDPWVLGSRLTTDAVIAYEGALSFYGLGPLDHSISILTRERAGPFDYDEIFYHPVRDPKRFARDPERGGQINEAQRSGQAFKVTSLERTLVDLLDRLDLCHGSRQLWDSFCGAPLLNPEAMVEYALRLKSRITAARLGFFLQQLGAGNHILHPLMRASPRSPSYFEPATGAIGERYYKAWRLVVSRQLRTHLESGQRVNPWRDLPEDDER